MDGDVRVLIVDDQELLRAGLRLVLEPRPGLTVVGEAGTGEEALDLLEAERIDVVLMDVRMPGMGGIEATRQVRARFPHTKVLLLTTFDEDGLIQEGLLAGADGYLLKDVPPDDLARALVNIGHGAAAIDPRIAKRFLDLFRTDLPDVAPPTGRLEELTAREREVFMLVAAGCTNTDISHRLGISAVTVRTHVDNIVAKLALRSRPQIIVYAYEQGVIQPSQRFDEESAKE
ncbi:MAG: response regulator transcription factor [Thermoactinospora sp.]|nr:response regulator transcription factor [Thermoactinospora sp.]